MTGNAVLAIYSKRLVFKNFSRGACPRCPKKEGKCSHHCAAENFFLSSYAEMSHIICLKKLAGMHNF